MASKIEKPVRVASYQLFCALLFHCWQALYRPLTPQTVLATKANLHCQYPK